MHTTTLLVFPIDMDETEAFIRTARSLGLRIVAASSTSMPPYAVPIDAFVHLPYVTAPDFDACLAQAVATNGIDAIHTPHQGIWRHLERLRKMDPQGHTYRLCGPDPLAAIHKQARRHEDWAREMRCSRLAEGLGTSPRPHLPLSAYAAAHRLFLGTPGQCDEFKLGALADIARVLPPGDIVEIGSLFGRSALGLAFFAARHGLGNIFCVDPWNSAQVDDQGREAELLNVEMDAFDWPGTFRIFLATAAACGNVGYIRDSARQAYASYAIAAAAGELHSPELGTHRVCGNISLLHVDGNHRYDQVKGDIAQWGHRIAPLGWLLIDDYTWAFGDGPRRAGDELLADGCYDLAFAAGDTLFLRRAAASPAHSG